MAQRLTTADWWTVSRFAFALSALALAGVADPDGAARWWVIALLALGAATDVIDGWWARRTATTSARGAVWDGRADKVLAVAAGIALAVFVEWVPAVLWTVVGVLAMRLLVAAIARVRVGVAIDHTLPNKVAGAAAMVAVITVLAVGTVANPWVVALLGIALGAALWAALADARAALASKA